MMGIKKWLEQKRCMIMGHRFVIPYDMREEGNVYCKRCHELLGVGKYTPREEK